MGEVDKDEKLTAGGYLLGGSGLFLSADAFGCARAYGYTDGTVIEFAIGAACLVGAAVVLYLAGMLRDRRAQERRAKRRMKRERRRKQWTEPFD